MVILNNKINMISFSPLIDKLISSLTCLPGVGPKSAQRMAFYLLDRRRDNGLQLAKTLEQAMLSIKRCQRCRTFSEETLCHFCQQTQRHQGQLCIIETPADVLAIEQTSSYKGLYFVLMGHLSPLDGIGPEELGISELSKRFKEDDLKEIIIATNPTVEGEATAHYIAELAKHYQLRATRIAHGVPMGGELEFIDGATLVRALEKREVI